MTTGILFAVLAGVSFGAYQIMNRQAGKTLGVTRGMTILLATCLVVTTTIMVVLKVNPITEHIPIRGWLFFAGAGLFHFLFGLSLIAMSQRSVGAGRTGALVGTTPLFATATGLIMLGEVVNWQTLLGITMIVMGAILVSTEKREEQTTR